MPQHRVRLLADKPFGSEKTSKSHIFDCTDKRILLVVAGGPGRSNDDNDEITFSTGIVYRTDLFFLYCDFSIEIYQLYEYDSLYRKNLYGKIITIFFLFFSFFFFSTRFQFAHVQNGKIFFIRLYEIFTSRRIL